MKICALVDLMGTMGPNGWMTEEDEYTEIKNQICDLLGLNPDSITYLTDVQPHELAGTSVDMYVIDYGGLMPGAESLVQSIFRELINQIEDKPNTLFVIWSSISFKWYSEIIEDENPELSKAPNVVIAVTDEGWDKMLAWFDIVPPIKQATKEPEIL